MALIVRAYGPADRAACERVFRSNQRLAYPAYGLPGGENEDFEALTAGEEIWVAELEGRQIAGFASIWRPERFIHHLFVDPAWHRQGVGRTLLAQALRQCGGHAELKCNEANRAAQAFYYNAGFRAIGWGWSASGPWIRFHY